MHYNLKLNKKQVPGPLHAGDLLSFRYNVLGEIGGIV